MMTEGLSAEVAKKRLATYGKNEIPSQTKIRPFSVFVSQFKSFLILILFAAIPVAYLAGERLDALFILVIVILNAIFGFVQEYRAEKAIESLKKLVVTRVRVIRDRHEEEIDSKELVPGDIFIIEEGQKISADAKLVEAFSLSVNEASLTGESSPVLKEAAIDGSQDERNLVFMGTSVEEGRGKARVLSTGLETRFGKIAQLLKAIKDEQTPLQEHLTTLGKQLAILAVLASFAVFGLGVVYGAKIIEMLLTAASLAVAVVPEGLPAVVTITLAIGVQRMARSQSIIRKLSSIEAIGSVDVILSDKTGTVTKNEMVVKRLWANKAIIVAKGAYQNDEAVRKILEIGILASSASLSSQEGGKVKIMGDRTEGALLMLAQEAGMDIEGLRRHGKILNQFPFDPHLKLMSVVWENRLGVVEVLTKGAPEVILDSSSKILIAGKVIELDANLRELVEKAIEREAREGYRLIAFGLRGFNGDPQKLERSEAERDLVFLGFVSIYDPPREEVKEAIRLAKRAGITIAMITGDNPLTAQAIATEIGLIDKEQEVLTGKILDNLSDNELKKKTETVRIFARVSPEHKLRIVKVFQDRGFSVAVTGDGVNDSPALKQADVGMAMGIIGTDVAKESSDMVIADDNFASIVKAVEEGRVVYENILKSTKYLLSCNSGELLAILGAVAFGLPSPLTPVQILWMNFVTDGLPALALAEDPKNPHIMTKPPRDKSKSILDILGKRWVISIGLVLGLLTFFAFLTIDLKIDLGKARTVAFTTLVAGEMVVAFLVRRGEKWYSNRPLILAVLTTIVLQFLIISLPPLQKIFDTKLPI